MQCQGNALAAGYADGVIRCWDTRSPQKIREFKGHTGRVMSVRFNEWYIVSGGSDKTMRVWDLRSGGMQDEVSFMHGVTGVDFLEERIYVCAGENDLLCYEREGGVFRMPGDNNEYGGVVGNGYHGASVECVKVSGEYAFSGSRDGIVNIWNI